MKKHLLLIIGLITTMTMQAQWANDPINNTYLANTSDDAGEILTATDPVSGDTYIQWSQFMSNGWVPKVQRINSAGVPQWDANGLQPAAQHTLASWSQGYAMTVTTDNAIVSCFTDEDGHSYAVKINADGTFAWGEAGILLFNGNGGSRVETVAGDDGGVWTLGSNYTNLFVQYVNADGTLNPMITISDSGGQSCMFGLLTLSNDNRVFVTYEKLGSGFYTDKRIFVAGYNTDGSSFSPETLLMDSQTFQSTYIHYVVPDGIGGGYAYIWHPGIGNAFNTYVFHFNANGVSTMIDANGTPVHSADPANYFISASATVDPISHDLIIVYEQTDAAYQAQVMIWVNRISSTGDRIWGDGVLVHDSGTTPCGGYRVDAFEYGTGFSVIYHQGLSQTSSQSTVEAKGFDMNHNVIWSTSLCSNPYNKTGDKNTPGFREGQNISVWVNAETGGLYGQNIGTKGEMGEILPPTPPDPCDPPTNFKGEYVYSNTMLGALVAWDAPETTPLHYNLYIDGLKDVIEIDPEYNSYFQELDAGDYTLRLTAVYETCESTYALTETGENYVLLTVTAVPENTDEEIITVTKVYTLSGQLIRDANPNKLSHGVYIIQGLSRDGNLVTRKMMVD